MKGYFISVVIPTYNRCDMLGEALASVNAQNSSPDEIIVVDDGSTDDTPRLFQCGNHATRYIRQENRGVAAARNRGVQEARGAWIAFLDSDDLWLPEKLTCQLQALAHHPASRICYTAEQWLRHDKPVRQKKQHTRYDGWIYRHCLGRCFVGCSTLVIRRDLWLACGGMDETLPAAEDYDLWLRLAWQHPFLLVDRPLTIKRAGHPGQLSHQRGLDRYRLRALLKMLEISELPEQEKEYTRVEAIHRCRILQTGCLKRSKIKEADYYAHIEQKLRTESNKY